MSHDLKLTKRNYVVFVSGTGQIFKIWKHKVQMRFSSLTLYHEFTT